MYGLLEHATVHTGDGEWARTMVDAPGSGTRMLLSNLCSPVSSDKFSGPASSTARPDALLLEPFALTVQMLRNNRCSDPTDMVTVMAGIEAGTEYALARALWYAWDGAGGWTENPFLTDPDVHTVSAGTDAIASVAAALSAFGERAAQVDRPVLHLGLDTAQRVARPIGVGVFEDYDTVISAAYPVNGVAVTGPIEIWIGSVQDLRGYDHEQNVTSFEATRTAMLQFDPYTAVRVA